jgi:hypothetical protein
MGLLVRRLLSAIVASFAIAAILSLVGYSDGGASSADVLIELIIAFSSYVTAALAVHWMNWSDKIWWDAISVSLLGSTISLLLQLVFVEGQNGIPAYFSRFLSERSLQPFFDLLIHATGFIAIVTVLALPFVFIVMVLCNLSTRMLAKHPNAR